jgi:hypothetical protein
MIGLAVGFFFACVLVLAADNVRGTDLMIPFAIIVVVAGAWLAFVDSERRR